MAQDLLFENCQYYRTLIPPIGGTISYELGTAWGSRIAVHGGRAQGLHGMGTLSSVATTIKFPDNYFVNIPIIEINVYYLTSEVVPTTTGEYVHHIPSDAVFAVPSTGYNPFVNLPIFLNANSPTLHTKNVYPSSIGTDGFVINGTAGDMISWFAKGV